MTFLVFDRRALKGDPALNDAYFTSSADALRLGNLTIAGGLTPLRAHDLVPWTYRAVQKRARLVASVPYILENGAGTDVTEDPAYASFMHDLRANLRRVEAAKTICGAGYLYLDSNTMGRNVTFRWLRSPFVQPRVETNKGITAWRCTDYYTPDVPRDIPLDRMIYFWNDNHASAVQPGAGEVEVGLGAASMLYALDAFTAGFFNSGGVKITAFEVPPNMSEPDKQAFQNFLNRALSGIRNAFKNIVVRGGIKPTVIGSSIKETLAPELVMQQRDNIAVAIGIPPGVVDGRSSDETNSRSEVLNMYLDTIIPEAETLYDALNMQFLERYGLKLRAVPAEMEIMQNAQLAQVQAVTLAVGGPVLTADEGRALLGYDPNPELAQPEPMEEEPADDLEGEPEAGDTMAPPQGMKAWREAALMAVRDGKSATDVPVSADIPLELVQAIDRELKAAKTAGQVRKAFARHWHETAPQSDLALAARELKRFNDWEARR